MKLWQIDPPTISIKKKSPLAFIGAPAAIARSGRPSGYHPFYAPNI